ncbi:MAG TPA: GHMP kinase [Candidatus Hydrogenedentes bacterium]|nr:GHMP kinase [Candidatus Hydrogenedentota bacterium]
MACEAVVYARAGLMGNPSDGYYGKTLSAAIRNFAARVSLYEHPELEIVPSFQDRSIYPGMRELAEDVRRNGYYGGIRLMKAAIKRFYDYCVRHDIPLDDRNFSIRYRSTIPRRLGLAGSSALVTATMRCLMEFYEVEIPKPVLPGLILEVETEELGIAAGLQDRVIQVYGGLVFMDFSRDLMERQGHGNYEELDPGLLPPLFLAYRTELGEGSEVVHNNIRQRWLDGDPEVHQAMRDFAEYAQQARDLLVAGRGMEIGPLMDKNFERRRSIMRLDPGNIEMVETARSVGAHAKFAGSGGAIVGMYYDENMYRRLCAAMEERGITVIRLDIDAP